MTAEYVTLPKRADRDLAAEILGSEPDLAGFEVFFANLVPRTEPLPTGGAATRLLADLRAANVRRLHASYWGSPTSFLTKSNFRELADRFGSLDGVREYYGDLTGGHMVSRWVDEYTLARRLGADSYVFHLIDYATLDGAWEFSHDKETIRLAMASMLQMFLVVLDDRGLVDDTAPLIEIENAGWGLEHGMQTAADATAVFAEIVDTHRRVRVGWDLNHLLHALGIDTETGRCAFLLPTTEITPTMSALEDENGDDPDALARAWIEANVTAPELQGSLGALHVSDCALKHTEFFSNGRLNPPYRQRQLELPTREERQEYGLGLVLEHYDSHLPLGQGCLDGRWLADLVQRLAEENPDLAVLHELKNSADLHADVVRQRSAIRSADARRTA